MARHFKAMHLWRCVIEADQKGRPTTRVQSHSGKRRGVVPIRAFLAERLFDPKATNAMSLAFGDACDAIGLHPTAKDPATSLVAEKVIELAIGGVHDPNALRTMTLEEFNQNDSSAQGRAPSRREAKRSQNQRSVREPHRNGPANQTFLLSRLAMTERHIAAGERHVARQREIVAELERHSGGNPETSKVAKELLQSFEMTQARHLEDRERLRRALGV
jgi:hypothetical protein